MMVILGECAQKGKPFGGMNFIYFGNYKQLSKPANHPMYYRARIEDTMDTKDMMKI